MSPKFAPKTGYNAVLEHPLIKSWLDNILSTPSRESRRFDLLLFIDFCKIKTIEDFGGVTRQKVINWRDYLNKTYAIRSVKRRMSSISKFYEYLCDSKIVSSNVVLGVERPKLTTNEGATAIISDKQAREFLEAPDPATIKGKRDRAILATFAYHALRRMELCRLKVKDLQEREGIRQFRIFGKGSKERYLPVHPVAMVKISEYLTISGHGQDKESPLFKSVSLNGMIRKDGLSPNAVYNLVIYYAKKVGIDTGNFSTHSLRATAATNAIRNGEDIRKVQHWLGHANVATTAMYDKRENRPEDSPTYRVKY